MKSGFSIAMCTYNGSSFLPEQLESIAAQTRLPDELVICDDRSSDGTAALIEEFAARTPFPVRLVVNGSTLGSTKNFENAISRTQHEVIVLADQDDVWYPDKLERMEQVFARSKDVVAAFSDADIIDDRSKSLGKLLWASFSFSANEQQTFSDGHALDVLVKHWVVTGATMAFRREWLGVLLPMPASDVHDRWISFLLAACGPITPISEPLMQYRRHHGQQIGAGASTFQARLARAGITGESRYQSDIDRFLDLKARLEFFRSVIPDAERGIREVENKIAHLQHRIGVRRMRLNRIPNVVREVCNRGYWRYAAGWESVAKDLFLYGPK